ncbi:uncharacterized protein K02A2.6-like [Tachysurus ichikawai]
MDTVQWGAYDDLSSREMGAGHCKGATSDTANAAPSYTDITPPKLARPSGGVLGQERLYQRQTNKSIDEIKSMSQGASILGSCETKNDNIIKLIGRGGYEIYPGRHEPFQKHPHLPVDLIFGLVEPTDGVTPKGYANQWVAQMAEAYKIAEGNSCQSSSRGKAQYDRKARGVVLKAGD